MAGAHEDGGVVTRPSLVFVLFFLRSHISWERSRRSQKRRLKTIQQYVGAKHLTGGPAVISRPHASQWAHPSLPSTALLPPLLQVKALVETAPAPGATQNCEPVTKAGVERLFTEWNDKLVNGSPKDVAAMYWPKGSVLLATLEDDPLVTPVRLVVRTGGSWAAVGGSLFLFCSLLFCEPHETNPPTLNHTPSHRRRDPHGTTGAKGGLLCGLSGQGERLPEGACGGRE